MWSPIHLKKQGNKNSVCVWGGGGGVRVGGGQNLKKGEKQYRESS